MWHFIIHSDMWTGSRAQIFFILTPPPQFYDCTRQIKEVGVTSDKIWSETERDYLCHGFQMFLPSRLNSPQNRIGHISKGICATCPKREKVAIVLDWWYLKGNSDSGETKWRNITPESWWSTGLAWFCRHKLFSSISSRHRDQNLTSRTRQMTELFLCLPHVWHLRLKWKIHTRPHLENISNLSVH